MAAYQPSPSQLALSPAPEATPTLHFVSAVDLTVATVDDSRNHNTASHAEYVGRQTPGLGGSHPGPRLATQETLQAQEDNNA